MTIRKSYAYTASLMLLSFVAQAHHSPAMFDLQNKITLTGSVREFQWTNPHSYIQLLVKDSKGKEVEWNLEMAAPTYLYNNGWRPKTLRGGDQVTIYVAPLRSGKQGGLVLEVTLANGKKLGGSKR